MMPIGPRGEKRPISPVQNAHRVFQIATGQAEEEYVDGRPWIDGQVIAMRIADKDNTSRKARKRRKKKS